MSSFKDIKPFAKPACASVTLPGSKSITNRAMILAAVAGGELEIKNALFSRDTIIMADCLKRLGYVVESDREARSIKISAEGSAAPNLQAELFVGNAGTAARFVTAFCAANKGGEYFFDSDEAMYKRPMKGLMDALREQGSEFEFVGQRDCFPFKMRAGGLAGGEVCIDASASSQLLSALLMAAPLAEKKTLVRLSKGTVSRPFVEMTVNMMTDFGFQCSRPADGVFEIVPRRPERRMSAYFVEPDATAASYFAILPALTGGAVLLENFANCSLQGDLGFLDVLHGCSLVGTSKVLNGVLAVGAKRPAGNYAGGGINFSDISDTFLTLAAASAALGGNLRIEGISHTRAQETDRVAAMAAELRKVCLAVSEEEDALEICPHKALPEGISDTPVRIKTYSDHRIAMSFGILGCADIFGDGTPWISIEDPQCVSKTWDNFFDTLDAARVASEKFTTVAVDGGAAVGKSSVSKAVSDMLHLMHVDTGAHYRTLTYALINAGLADADEAAVEGYLSDFKLGTAFDPQRANSARMTLCGELVKDEDLRTKAVNDRVSVFASMPSVRNFLKGYQRSMASYAREHGFSGLIMEGRDIGSVIFPDADVRIFLDADEQTRAQRRAKEGISDSISARDRMDRSRKTAPLVCPEGAVRIDTSNMTKEDVISRTAAEICRAK